MSKRLRREDSEEELSEERKLIFAKNALVEAIKNNDPNYLTNFQNSVPNTEDQTRIFCDIFDHLAKGTCDFNQRQFNKFIKTIPETIREHLFDYLNKERKNAQIKQFETKEYQNPTLPALDKLFFQIVNYQLTKTISNPTAETLQSPREHE